MYVSIQSFNLIANSYITYHAFCVLLYIRITLFLLQYELVDDLGFKTPKFVRATDVGPSLPPRNPPKQESSSSKNLSQLLVSSYTTYI